MSILIDVEQAIRGRQANSQIINTVGVQVDHGHRPAQARVHRGAVNLNGDELGRRSGSHLYHEMNECECGSST
jgi:hypothetical protein